MTKVPENLSDEDVSDPELHRALRESRESHRVEQFQRRGGEGSSRAELGRSASMRAPEGFGHNKRLLNVGIGLSDRQPRVDNYLYSKQTSRQPKISNVVLRGIKDAKQYLGRAWTKFFVHDGIPADVANSAYFKKAIEATQECGTGVRAPNSYDIYNKYLPKEVEEIENHIKNFHSH